MATTHTPLRYPGGKSSLTKYVHKLLLTNGLIGCDYAEPYAGGAGLAINLLLKGFVNHIHINDLDRAIYSFWFSALNATDLLCEYIEKTPITLEERAKQKQVYENKQKADLISLGLATLFLNRTNRSGILKAGVIGGKNQIGRYKIDARFNRITLIKKIRTIASLKAKITIQHTDALDFIKDHCSNLSKPTLINLDPPYYVKGQMLYQNAYEHSDHKKISAIIPNLKPYWIITYDNVPQVKELYSRFPIRTFNLSYSAHTKYQGKEILIADPRLELPQDDMMKAS